jgi:hypothetical protein
MLEPMRRTWWITWLALVACGVEEPGDPMGFGDSGNGQGCIPGEQRACACPGGAPDGVQVCADEGDRFEACVGCPGGSEGGTLDGADTSDATDTGASTGGGGGSSSTSSEGGSSETWGLPPGGPPDEFDVVQQVAMEHPDWLLASCVDTGGNNEFLFEVVRRLRMIDQRWGMNWKRGMIGDLSQDVVDYHWGEGEPEESTDVFIIDIIVGHCGDDPQPGWIDVTLATLEGDTVGMWTLAGQDL